MAVNIKKEQGNNRNRKPDITALVYGKVPPQAPELEEAVLGALMLEKDRLAEVLGIIPEPDCFYVDAHQKIYAAIKRLNDKGMPVDLLTVTEELRKTKEIELVGGEYYLTKLTMNVVSSANVEAHSGIVMEKFLKRELIRVSGRTISEAYEDISDPFDLQVKFLEEVNRVFKTGSGRGWVSAETVARDYLQEREDRLTGKTGTVISTTFPYVDHINIGFRPTQFILIGARPSVGKSAFVLPIVINTAEKHGAVGIINLEMENTQTFGRMISQRSGVGFTDLEKNYNIGEDVLINHVGKLSKLPVYFNSVPSMNIHQIVAAATWLKEEKDVQLLVIDFLQLIEEGSNNRNREQNISATSRALKVLARTLKIPVIAIVSLNRQSESRQDKKPQLGDLRESGSLESDGDIVMLLHRDWQAGIEQDAEGKSTETEADLIIAKWRNGKTGSVKLHFDGPTMKFSEPPEIAPYPERQINHNATMQSAFQRQRPQVKDNEGEDAPF